MPRLVKKGIKRKCFTRYSCSRL